MKATRAELEAAFERIKDREFYDYRSAIEPASLDDEILDLHAELEEYDGYTAGLIMQILDGNDAVTHPLKKAPDLRRRLEQIRKEGGERANLARTYLRHLDAIENLVGLGQAALDRSNAGGNSTRAPF